MSPGLRHPQTSLGMPPGRIAGRYVPFLSVFPLAGLTQPPLQYPMLRPAAGFRQGVADCGREVTSE